MLGPALRLALLLWPFVAWLVLRGAASQAFTGTEWYRAGVTGSALVLWLAVVGLRKGQLVGPATMGFAVLLTVASGAWGLWWEWLRWQPSLALGTGTGTVLVHADWALVLVSLSCFAAPVFGWRLGSHAFGAADGAGTFGTARWLSIAQALRLFSRGSLVIGEAYEPQRRPGDAGRATLLRFDGAGHLLTVAGSGSGKTVSVVVPNALTWAHNLVVHDPKGEVVRLVRDARQRDGRRVVALDPEAQASESLNVLGWIDRTRDTAVADARAVAAWLMPSQGNADPKGAYFRQAATSLLEVLILDALVQPEVPQPERNLATVRRRLTGALEGTLQRIVDAGPAYAWGAARDRAQSLLKVQQSAPAQWAGVVGEADSATGWLAIPSLARLVCGTGSSRFELDELLQTKVDVFVCVPLKTLESTPQLPRLLIGALLNAVYERHRSQQGTPSRVLFLLDEMPRLGKMDVLETARDAGRGLGVTLWSIVQDLGQLEAAYGSTGLTSWMENAQIKQFFGISDVKTAELVSKMLGQRTQRYSTSSSSSGSSGWVFGTPNAGSSTSEAVTGRALLTPDEVMRLGVDANGVPDEQLVFVRNQWPLRCGMAKHFRRTDLVPGLGESIVSQR